MKNIIPWWLKIAIKILLSKLPISYSLWARIGLFRHGSMDQIDYSVNVINQHLKNANIDLMYVKGSNILELGPGDSLATAIFAKSCGASSVLVDVDDFASNDMVKYNKLHEKLIPREKKNYQNINDMLLDSNATYMTNGLRSLMSIPSESIDFVFSHAVLEHVKLSEFRDVQRQLFRVMKVGSKASHRVDLKDHLAGSLNNLRFSDLFWERELIYNSGFYTNRLRFSEIIDIFDDIGFSVSVVSKDLWNQLPLPREKMASPFDTRLIDDLCCSGFTVLLTKME